MDPRLEIIGQEWKQRSRDLADWAMDRLVNRRDVWGQYTGKPGPNKALTLPQKSMRGSGDMVTLDKLTRHFGSLRRNHLIGLHAQSADGRCKWLAIDIDLHDPEALEAEEAAARNFASARAWWEMLVARGYDPLLFDSNGAGGFHLWVLFAEPVPMADAHGFGQDIADQWEAKNLDVRPETFPKSEKLADDKLGAWLRLPGLHHSRDHFHRVWSGDEWLDDPWLDGNEAIEVMLSAAPGPAPNPAKPGKRKKTGAASKRPAIESKKRPRVCVDLDGVLARYDGWRGVANFGLPIPGAPEFTRELAQWADVIVYTTRCTRSDSTHSIAERVRLVRGWLDEHGFTYHEVYAGQGKPLAQAYIDDRGIGCRPQEDGPRAFQTAMDAAKSLSARNSG